MAPQPDIGTLRLDDDSDQEDLFDSPEKTETNHNGYISEPTPSRHGRHDEQESRDAALRKELESVRSVNKVIEGVINSLEKAKGNMNVGAHQTIASCILLTFSSDR